MSSYINGSDLLVMVEGKAIGHCTTHTSTYSTETSDVAVKPVASESKDAGSKFKEKKVTGLSIQVKAEGLSVYSESERSVKSLLKYWYQGSTVTLQCFERENDASPYLAGDFIISSLETTNAAGEDVTYSVTFDNSGAPDTFEPDNYDIENSEEESTEE